MVKKKALRNRGADVSDSGAQESEAREIRLKRVKKTDDFVWKLPGFDKNAFYAAADYLRRPGKNQGLLPSNPKQAGTNPSTPQLERDMLDYLALLFARVKTTDDPPRHVSATALKTVDKGLGLEIWIAKNDGAKEQDEQFRSDLELWFNRKGPWKNDPEAMKSDIEEYWDDRLNYYCKNFQASRSVLRRGPNEEPSKVASDTRTGLQASYYTLLELYEKKDKINIGLFEQDWAEVQALCTDPDISQEKLKARNDTARHRHFEQAYAVSEREHTKGQAKLATYFSKLLKSVRLLRTVPKAIKAFSDFREKSFDVNIKFKFLNPIATLDLEPKAWNDFANTMEGWTRSLAKENKEFVDEVQTVANSFKEQAQKQKSFHRYFHCELQMLDKFLDDTSVYDYFGCSKLSCFMCWRVLQGTPFKTRETHANLWPACAFPFTTGSESSNSHYQLLLALKKVQDYLLERVLRRALDFEFNFPDNISLPETEPDGELRRRNETQISWRTIDNRLVKVSRAQAIRIPVDGKPLLESIDFRAKDPFYSRFQSARSEWDEYSDNSFEPFIWSDNQFGGLLSDVQTSQQVYSKTRDSMRTAIVICGRVPDSSSSVEVDYTGSLRVNSWYRDLIKAVHGYSYDHKDRTCRWRGELYVFRNVFVEPLPDPQLRPIEEEEMEEVVQKCRDVLTGSWVCFFNSTATPGR